MLHGWLGDGIQLLILVINIIDTRWKRIIIVFFVASLRREQFFRLHQSRILLSLRQLARLDFIKFLRRVFCLIGLFRRWRLRYFLLNSWQDIILHCLNVTVCVKCLSYRRLLISAFIFAFRWGFFKRILIAVTIICFTFIQKFRFVIKSTNIYQVTNVFLILLQWW